MNPAGHDPKIIRTLHAVLMVLNDTGDQQGRAPDVGLPAEIKDALDKMDRNEVRQLLVEVVWRLVK